jgi:hypothetical protein
VVSQLRFSGPVPWVSASTGQSLLSCLYGPASSTASTGQLPLWSSLQFYGVGALSPVLRGWCPLSSSRVGAQLPLNRLVVSLKIVRIVILNSQIEPQMESLIRSRSLEALNMYHF